MSTYTTIQGDVWDMIAYKVYGDESRMKELIEANGEHADTAVFSQGVVLTCPEIDTESVSTLPPWRR